MERRWTLVNNTKQKLVSLIYRRCSDSDNDNSISTASQKDEVISSKKSLSHKLDTSEYKDEGVTGRTDKRPGFQKLLERINAGGVEAIFVFDQARLFRNTQLFVDFMENVLKPRGIRLISINENFCEGYFDNLADRESSIQQAVRDEHMALSVSAKVKSIYSTKFKHGVWPGRAKLGYSFKKEAFIFDGYKIGKHIPSKPQFDYLKDGIRVFLSGNLTIKELSSRLYKKGLKTRNGQRYAHSTIHRVLTDPFYYGSMNWNGVTTIGIHEPMITKEEFDKVQRILSTNRHGAIRIRKHNFLLRGLLYCSICGDRMTAEPHDFKNGKRVCYYHCQKKKECSSKYIEINVLEEKVEEKLKSIRVSDEFLSVFDKVVSGFFGSFRTSYKNEMCDIRNKLIQQTALFNKAQGKMLEGVMTDDRYKRFIDDTERNEIYLRTELAKLKLKKKEKNKVILLLGQYAKSVQLAYSNASNDNKRILLSQLFSKIKACFGEEPVFVLSKGARALIKAGYLKL